MTATRRASAATKSSSPTIRQRSAIRANGLPLRFSQFTKVERTGAVMLDYYAGDNLQEFELVECYKCGPKCNASHSAASLPRHFGRFSNGGVIPHPGPPAVSQPP